MGMIYAALLVTMAVQLTAAETALRVSTGLRNVSDPVHLQHCALRHLEHRPLEAPRHDLSIVVSTCKSRLSGLARLKCNHEGRKLWFFVYLRCKDVPKGYPREELASIRACFTTVEAYGQPHQATPAHHALSPHAVAANRTLFLAPGVTDNKTGCPSISDVVSEAVSTPLGFQSFGNVRTNIGRSTMGELCYALQRYTCLQACTPRGMEEAKDALWLEPREVSHMVDSHRMWSLRSQEYQWLQLWASRTSDKNANSMWSYVWGCPEDARSKKRLGCKAGEAFPGGLSGSSPFALADLTSSKLQPKQWRVLPHECVHRRHDQLPYRRRLDELGEPPLPGAKPRLGIVLVMCTESVTAFQDIQCQPDNPDAVLHIYSKCGKRMDEVSVQLGGMAACVRTFKTVPPTLQSEIAWPKHHEQYLEHIITNYGRLEPAMLFLKANFPARNLELPAMISDASTHKWEFKSLGLPKVVVDLNAFPENGNEPVWREEICALYRRYHCVDVCALGDARSRGLDPVIYNTRSMWTATAARIRSLPVSEYQWWREYILAPAHEDGVKRRYMLERLWQALLGCPQEHIEPDSNVAFGCVRGQAHPSGGAQLPPAVLLSKGLVSWPQPDVAQFDPLAPYPHFDVAYPATHAATTFVFACTGQGRAREHQRQAIRLTAAAALKLHPGSRLVVLHDDEPSEGGFWKSEFWMNRVEVVRFDARNGTRPSFFSLMAQYILHRQEAEAADTTRLTLENAFLAKISSDPEAATKYGNLVFMDGYALPVAPLDQALALSGALRKRLLETEPDCGPAEPSCHADQATRYGGQADIAIPAGNAPEDPLDPGTWYVAKDRIPQAAAFTKAAIGVALPGERIGQAMARVVRCCSGKGSWWKAKTRLTLACDLSACGSGSRHSGSPLVLNMLPCSIWLASLYGARAEACPVKGLQTNALHFPSTQEGRRALSAASFMLKDKSTRGQTLKNAIYKFVYEADTDKTPPATIQYYLALLASRAMYKVWMPREKQALPVVGSAAKRVKEAL